MVLQEDSPLHLLRTEHCYCEKLYSTTGMCLVVLEVKKDPNGIIYQNEEGLAYLRRHGSNQCFSINHLYRRERFAKEGEMRPEDKELQRVWQHIPTAPESVESPQKD